MFFHYQTLIQENNFRAIQTKQNLTVDFPIFLDICQKIVDDCSSSREDFQGIFKFRTDGQVKVAFFQNLGYKYIELLALEFQPSTDQEIKDHVKRTYHQLKIENQNAKNRLAEVLNVVKAKNPSLLLYLQQASVPPSFESGNFNKKAGKQR